MTAPSRQKYSPILLTKPMEQLNFIKQDQQVFLTLPNEIILHVFTYLRIADLLECGQVSKRFRAICNDDKYLWPKMANLCYKKVPVGFLQKLLECGCKYLGLSEAILDQSDGALNLPKASSLKYLDLSGFGTFECMRENSEILLESCYSLQKLSLSKAILSRKMISTISLQNGKTLRVLDLSRCTFCYGTIECTFCCVCKESVPIEKILKNCTELKEFSLRKTRIHSTSVDFFVTNLTSKIEKLDLFGVSHLTDMHAKTLVTRCNKITELNLGGWKSRITTQSLNFIIEHLKLTLVNLNLESTHVWLDFSDLSELTNLEKLESFHYDYAWGHEDDALLLALRKLGQLMSNLKINCPNDNTKIASPFHPETEYNPRLGFWEIKVEREELFDNFFSNQYLKTQYFTKYRLQPTCSCCSLFSEVG